MVGERGECVSAGGCVNEHPYDNVTVRLSMYFVRTLGHQGAERFYVPPQRELFDLNLDAIEIYGFTVPEVCIFTDPFLPEPLDLCQNDNKQWVPKWYAGHEPAVVNAATFPNNLNFDAVAMAIDCSDVMQGFWSQHSTDVAKMVTWPLGPQGGPCWFDPDYGENRSLPQVQPGVNFTGELSHWTATAFHVSQGLVQGTHFSTVPSVAQVHFRQDQRREITMPSLTSRPRGSGELSNAFDAHDQTRSCERPVE